MVLTDDQAEGAVSEDKVVAVKFAVSDCSAMTWVFEKDLPKIPDLELREFGWYAGEHTECPEWTRVYGLRNG